MMTMANGRIHFCNMFTFTQLNSISAWYFSIGFFTHKIHTNREISSLNEPPIVHFQKEHQPTSTIHRAENDWKIFNCEMIFYLIIIILKKIWKNKKIIQTFYAVFFTRLLKSICYFEYNSYLITKENLKFKIKIPEII